MAGLCLIGYLYYLYLLVFCPSMPLVWFASAPAQARAVPTRLLLFTVAFCYCLCCCCRRRWFDVMRIMCCPSCVCAVSTCVFSQCKFCGHPSCTLRCCVPQQLQCGIAVRCVICALACCQAAPVSPACFTLVASLTTLLEHTPVPRQPGLLHVCFSCLTSAFSHCATKVGATL